MPRFKYLLLSIFITVVIPLPFYFHLSGEYKEKTLTLAYKTQTLEVPNVIARVGEYQISKLSGYASPFAEVELTAQGTARKTFANNAGYFEFIFSPIKKTYGELCLTSIDVFRTPTSPVCLPPPPMSENIEIEGVLLPPSILLEKGKILAGQPAKASGMTFPNSEVDVYLFKEDKTNILENIFSVYAAGLPRYSIKSNANGYFEFSLPTARISENRLFATAIFDYLKRADIKSAPTLFSSPKSNTLSFLVFKTSKFAFLIFFLLLLLALLLLRKKRPKALLIVENNLALHHPACQTEIFSGPKILKI